MAIKTPTINRIFRVTQWDLMITSIKAGNMYMCIDNQILYYDETDSKRVVYAYKGVKTINDLLYNITPVSNSTYYCWEDNSLWLWMNKWITLWSDSTYPSAYVYNADSYLDPIYRNDQPLLPADDNGLLKDGSVVIRDRNRIIKGKLYVDDGNDNLIISSYLGGGVRILPNGQIDTEGEFYIGDEGKSFIRSEFHDLNNEMFVDYSEKPESDPSKYPNSTHIYKVFHEGNLDASAIKILTPQDIYEKLLDPSLPNPFDFNVNKLSGYTIDELAKKEHNHNSSQILDFNTEARAQALLEITSVFNAMNSEGVDIYYSSATKNFTLSANNFTLNFAGGVKGSGVIQHLSDATINLMVDPSQHIHQNYIDRMDDIEEQIKNITTIDPDNYYDKSVIDQKLLDISGTTTPQAGKTLLVNEDLILPGTAESSTKLNKSINIAIEGDIQGSADTDLSNNVIITVNAENIISDSPVPGKALKIDSNNNLPANAATASALNHIINLNLEGDILGNAELDTSSETVIISTNVNNSGNILSKQDLGITVASLDSNGKIPASQLPETNSNLEYQGYWNPETGSPSETPIAGQFWIANTAGIFEDIYYNINDWCVYLNSQWNKLSTSQSVVSVNNKTGIVTLNSDDVNAISKEYINYNFGDIIPANKLVVTNADGQISGATVGALTNPFSLLSDAQGDIEFSADSINLDTNGSENLNVKMIITENGYNNILNKVGYNLQNNGSSLPYLNTINFENGFSISQDGIATNISVKNSNSNTTTLYWDGISTEPLSILSTLYNNRNTDPILLYVDYNNKIISYIIDGSYEDVTADNLTIILNPNNTIISIDNNSVDNIKDINSNIYKLKLTFSIDSEIISIVSTEFIDETQLLGTFVEKDYVDNKIISSSVQTFTGSISLQEPKEYLITHNLNTSNLLIQFRTQTDHTELFITNSIVDNNTIKIITNQSYTDIIDYTIIALK